MARVILDGAHCPELLADMEEAARVFIERFERDPGLWTRAPEGKWSGGQHAEHLASSHREFADLFETAIRRHEAGDLPGRPGRGLLQKLAIHLFTQRAKFPRGGRAHRMLQPAATPDRGSTLATLRGEVARYRRLVDRISESERERVWIRNPLVPFRWHYTLPEALRIHAQHTRHHGMLVEKIARRDA